MTIGKSRQFSEGAGKTKFGARKAIAKKRDIMTNANREGGIAGKH